MLGCFVSADRFDANHFDSHLSCLCTANAYMQFTCSPMFSFVLLLLFCLFLFCLFLFCFVFVLFVYPLPQFSVHTVIFSCFIVLSARELRSVSPLDAECVSMTLRSVSVHRCIIWY